MLIHKQCCESEESLVADSIVQIKYFITIRNARTAEHVMRIIKIYVQI